MNSRIHRRCILRHESKIINFEKFLKVEIEILNSSNSHVLWHDINVETTIFQLF
jgi:hypothetical protein